MSHSKVFYRNLNWDYPQVSHADGLSIWDESGKEYSDYSGGAFVNCVGHGCSELIDALTRQLYNVSYVNGLHFSSKALEEYAQCIADISPGKLNKTLIFSSGSEAIEAAAKITLQIQKIRGFKRKHQFIARSPGYHGNTFMALSLSGRKSYQKEFSGNLYPVEFVETPHEFFFDGDWQSQASDYYYQQFVDKVNSMGAENIAGFFFEPMSASSAACSGTPENLLLKIQKFCREKDILMIADEVACGAGRSGKYFASEQEGLEPDLLCLGKSVNAGIIPASVLLCSDEIFEDYRKNNLNLSPAQTFMQSPSQAACVLEVFKYVHKKDLIAKVRSESTSLISGLREKLLKHEHVACVQGKGFLIGIELMKNTQEKTSFDRERKVIERFHEFAFKSGFIFWSAAGQRVDCSGDSIILAPPFTTTKKEQKTLVTRLDELLGEFFEKEYRWKKY